MAALKNETSLRDAHDVQRLGGRLQQRQDSEAIMIDLSFLTEEEQESILAVLQRDASLKKAEEERMQ